MSPNLHKEIQAAHGKLKGKNLHGKSVSWTERTGNSQLPTDTSQDRIADRDLIDPLFADRGTKWDGFSDGALQSQANADMQLKAVMEETERLGLPPYPGSLEYDGAQEAWAVRSAGRAEKDLLARLNALCPAVTFGQEDLERWRATLALLDDKQGVNTQLSARSVGMLAVAMDKMLGRKLMDLGVPQEAVHAVRLLIDWPGRKWGTRTQTDYGFSVVIDDKRLNEALESYDTLRAGQIKDIVYDCLHKAGLFPYVNYDDGRNAFTYDEFSKVLYGQADEKSKAYLQACRRGGLERFAFKHDEYLAPLRQAFEFNSLFTLNDPQFRLNLSEFSREANQRRESPSAKALNELHVR